MSISQEDKDKVKGLIAAGFSPKDAAKEAGISDDDVSLIVRRYAPDIDRLRRDILNSESFYALYSKEAIVLKKAQFADLIESAMRTAAERDLRTFTNTIRHLLPIWNGLVRDITHIDGEEEQPIGRDMLIRTMERLSPQARQEVATALREIKPEIISVE